ncbi:MAG: 3-keto-5-aminohexanoate cleavage protein [Acidimicrobiia bacterium]
MDKLIITVTVDSSMSYPGNPNMPPIEDTDAVGQQYIDAVRAGASICHHHGVHYLEEEMQEDGRRLSRVDIDGWARVTDKIKSGGDDPIIQFGIASARLPEKVELMKLGPDMMSYAFNVHDEYFRPDPAYPANEMYALHPRDELEEFCAAAKQHSVKPEIECFYTGAFWNLSYIRGLGSNLLADPVWATLFFGWPGGAWTPPTEDAVLFMASHVPDNVLWNMSCMDPQMQFRLIPLVISLGGHVRVGWEDNPYRPNGEWAPTNAELVELVVEIAERMGREVATPQEARRMLGLA